MKPANGALREAHDHVRDVPVFTAVPTSAPSTHLLTAIRRRLYDPKTLSTRAADARSDDRTSVIWCPRQPTSAASALMSRALFPFRHRSAATAPSGAFVMLGYDRVFSTSCTYGMSDGRLPELRYGPSRRISSLWGRFQPLVLVKTMIRPAAMTLDTSARSGWCALASAGRVPPEHARSASTEDKASSRN